MNPIQNPQLPPDHYREINGPELYARSAAGLTLGILPFSIYMLSLQIFRGIAAAAHFADVQLNYLQRSNDSTPRRISAAIFGIPALITSFIMALSAKIFAEAQVVAWGRDLVRFPQEERINTKLARYGEGKQPWVDLGFIYISFYFRHFHKDRLHLQGLAQFDIR